MRITPELVSELKVNDIFVFGSNEGGKHGAGAALYAYQRFGAIYRQGVGLQGQTYAIPTKDTYIETLPIEIIKTYVDEFIVFAKDHPDLTFLVTLIGCGRANYKPDAISHLFAECISMENVYLPLEFIDCIKGE
jgi:hypothetical protein